MEPTLKLKEQHYGQIHDTPRGVMLLADDVLAVISSLLDDERTTVDDLKELHDELAMQIELAPHALNHYK
jgi:hypothetical protein